MPSKQPKSLILAIHIDSTEINLAAGFVEDGKVNLVALHRTTLQGIAKGNIIDKEYFENSFCIAVQNFLDHNCKVADPQKVKDLNLDVDSQGRLAIKKTAYNLLVSDTSMSRLSSSDVQSKVVKDILTRHFSQGNLRFVEGENVFTCTADTATTNLFVDDSEDLSYQININFGRFSTGINFISNTKSKQIFSRSVELGFEDLLTDLNRSTKITPLTPPCNAEELYTYLKNYIFVIPSKSKSRTRFIRQLYENRSNLDEIFIGRSQYIAYQLYQRFCELDHQKVRFKPDFADKLKINITGYMADFVSFKDCISLIFSERLKEELEQLKSQNSDNLTSSSPSQSNFVLNTATGLVTHNSLPKASGSFKLIYQVSNNPNLLHSRSLSVTDKISDLTYLCCNNPADITEYKLQLDRFASVIGLIYYFYLNEPPEIAKNNKFSFKNFIARTFKFS